MLKAKRPAQPQRATVRTRAGLPPDRRTASASTQGSAACAQAITPAQHVRKICTGGCLSDQHTLGALHMRTHVITVLSRQPLSWCEHTTHKLRRVTAQQEP